MSHAPLPEPPAGPYDMASVRGDRAETLHALHALEHALTAPAPRRQRTWLHRVTAAVDAVQRAVTAQTHANGEAVDLLAEIALTEPSYALRVQRLRHELLDIAIAVASLREQIEPEPTMTIDPDDVRDRLATVTRRFRQHRAQEADLIYEATGVIIDTNADSAVQPRDAAG